MAGSAPVRSVAESIRQRDAAALVRLLTLRPDLAQPRPVSMSELVERAVSPVSTHQAIDALNAWQQRVAHALAACPEPESVRRLATLLEADKHDVEAAVDDLVDRALAWGTSRSVQLTQAARSRFGTYPAGLAGASPIVLDDATIDAQLTLAGPSVQPVLDRLVWGPPTGSVKFADRTVDLDRASSPVERLLATRLVRPLDAETIVVPREVALRLRGGRLFADRVNADAPAWPPVQSSRVAEAAALGTAAEFVTTVTTVIDEVGRRGPRVLASGGLPRRDLGWVHALTGSPNSAMFALHLAHQAGLMGTSGATWLPTATFDRWATMPLWPRWQSLVDAWLGLPVWTDRVTTPLAPAIGHEQIPALRRLAHQQMRAAAAGTPIEPGLLEERLAWTRPSWVRHDLGAAARTIVAEAAELGVVVLGHRSALLDADSDPGLPAAVQQFLVQSDLTAVAAAPLTREVAQVLDLVTDRESGGVGSVHRFTSASLRQGLDAGWTADGLLGWLAEHSATPVPQPLEYLLSDAARAHGSIQIAPVAAIVQVDNEAVAESLLRHPQAPSLGLRRLAPRVLAAQADPAEVAEVLRGLGHAPVAQDASGQVVRQPGVRRARPVPPASAPIVPSTADLHSVATSLLADMSPGRHAQQSAGLVAVLQDARSSHAWIRVDHVDDHGVARSDTVRVMAVASGQARLQRRAAASMVVPLSRIIAATPVT